MRSTFALAEYNLKRNPFGIVPWQDWPKVIVADLEGWIAHLQQPGTALQLIGEGGRGKSTHLRTLHRYFLDSTYTYIPPGRRIAIPDEPRLFLDESQRLPWWRRERHFRKAKTLAIATHKLHTKQLERLGYRVITHEVKGLDIERLRAITQKRIEWARKTSGPLPFIPDESLEYLLTQHQDNLRAIESELYEVFQNRKETGHVCFKFVA
jgi:energy-coupling factor transporter ATP-binding protein EcfA2